MTSPTDLIERLEGASVGTSELDLAVGQVLGLIDDKLVYTNEDGSRSSFGNCDPWYPWTQSIDHGLRLAERVLPGVWWVIGKGKLRDREPEYGAQLMFGADQVLGSGEGATASLALCIAILRASEQSK